MDDEGRVSILTKYNTINYYGTIDNLTTLQPVDDAATIRIGDGARTPTKEEWQELIDNTSIGTTTINGVSGRIFTASNGNSIFMPSAGSCLGSSPYAAGNLGSYWTASISTETPASAWLYEFRPSGRSMEHRDRVNGNSVRAVHDKLDPNPQPNPQPVPEGWVDLALPSGLLWAECNVGAMAPEQDGYYYSWGEIMPKDYYDWYHYAYGDEHQLTIYGHTVGVGRAALLLDELLYNDMATDAMLHRIFQSGLQLFGFVHTGHTLAACRIGGLHDDRILVPRRICQGFFYGRKALCLGHIEVVFGQERTELVLVLEDLHTLEGAKGRQPHLVLHIRGSHHAGVAGEGHNAINLELLGFSEHSLLIYDTDIAILIAPLVSDIVGQIVRRYHIVPLLMGCINHRLEVAQPAKEHNFLLLHSLLYD